MFVRSFILQSGKLARWGPSYLALTSFSVKDEKKERKKEKKMGEEEEGKFMPCQPDRAKGGSDSFQFYLLLLEEEERISILLRQLLIWRNFIAGENQ